MSRNIIFATFVWALSASAGCATEGDGMMADFYQASSVHLKGGKHAEPAFFDAGLTLTASGSLSGLGNADVTITLDATAIPDARCTNPSGANQPPGQNPAPVDVTGSVSLPKEQIENGNLAFSVTTEPPETPIAGAPDCPNKRWTETIVDLAFESGTITVEQPAGTTVLTVSCTFSALTTDGAVPAAQVSCSSS